MTSASAVAPMGPGQWQQQHYCVTQARLHTPEAWHLQWTYANSMFSFFSHGLSRLSSMWTSQLRESHKGAEGGEEEESVLSSIASPNYITFHNIVLPLHTEKYYYQSILLTILKCCICNIFLKN